MRGAPARAGGSARSLRPDWRFGLRSIPRSRNTAFHRDLGAFTSIVRGIGGVSVRRCGGRRRTRAWWSRPWRPPRGRRGCGGQALSPRETPRERANRCRRWPRSLSPRWVWSSPTRCRPTGGAASSGARSSVQNGRVRHRSKSKRPSRRPGVAAPRSVAPPLDRPTRAAFERLPDPRLARGHTRPSADRVQRWRRAVERDRLALHRRRPGAASCG